MNIDLVAERKKNKGKVQMKWEREVGSVKKNNLTPDDALNQKMW